MRQRKLDPLLVKVMAAIHQTAEKPAKGFRTIDEWAAKWKVQRSSARMMLLKGVKLGLVEKRTYLRVIRKDAKPYPTAHFGEKTRPRKT
jgi:hypothetical protein